MKKFINCILYLWQLPQHILALLLEAVLCWSCTRSDDYNGNHVIVCPIITTALSLGKYIFMNPSTTQTGLQHESGHCRQSLILGPVYLLVIAIPSVLHFAVLQIARKFGKEWDYYSFYTEKWADSLAGITRLYPNPPIWK